jgi:dTDP-4-dehydrorhamnose reductase
MALIGAGGQLASDLARSLNAERLETFTHLQLDITDAAAIARLLDAASPDMVVNASGYNLVDQAEVEPEHAFAVNAFGVRNLAQYCGQRGIALVHVSTDYVFGGGDPRAMPLNESDCPQPLSVYGASKLAGEHFVRAECPRHLIVRTCGLYGLASTRAKGNFIETMLRLSETRPEIRVVNDQHCTPSFTSDVAQAIEALIAADANGIYHVTNSGAATWYDLAAEVFRLAKRDVSLVPITSQEFGAKAQRPAYSVLDCSKLTAATGLAMPNWADSVATYLKMREIQNRNS